jgi:hypothetical protein
MADTTKEPEPVTVTGTSTVSPTKPDTWPRARPWAPARPGKLNKAIKPNSKKKDFFITNFFSKMPGLDYGFIKPKST